MQLIHRILASFSLLCAIAAGAHTPDNTSFAGWPEPTPLHRPGTRWWWMGSAVDSANIERCLLEYSRAGIGTVEITPIYGVQDNECREIPFLSDDWMRQLRNVYAAAERHGMIVDMNQGTGWPFGGPGVGIDDAACKIILLVDTVAHGSAPVKTLAEKDRDTAVPLAENRRRLPDCRDEVIRAWQGRTLQRVKRAAPGGEGLVIDHFDRGAVQRYLDRFDRAFLSTGTPWPHSFFNDSYEVYNANWTPSLPEEFMKRRGYNLLEYLAELAGTVDDRGQVLADYRRTLGELLLENFTETWAARAHARGAQVRNQAHGSPANLIDIYAAVDVPEIEGFGLSDFGIKGLRTDPGHTRPNHSDVSMLKYASSAAHITGKPLVSSETLTWLTDHFRTSLSQMKPDIDLMLTCGVNRIFYHGTAYSPDDAEWPGWKFYASVDISPTNTIWADLPAMNQYITRCQGMLQAGRPDNDFLVYLPVDEMWHKRLKPGEKGLLMTFAIDNMRQRAPEFIDCIMLIDSLGYDCDYISDRYLEQTRVVDGQLVTPGGIAYKALILPDGVSCPAAARLAAAGATVVSGVDRAALAASAKAEPMRMLPGLRAIRRAVDGGTLYFIANLGPDDIDTEVSLAADGRSAKWYDPLNGDIYPARFTPARDGDMPTLGLAMLSGESRILVTSQEENDASCGALCHADGLDPRVIDLSDGEWRLMPRTGGHEGRRVPSKVRAIGTLKPWTALGDDSLDEYAGTMSYMTEFEMDADTAGRWMIDLGDVRESARVWLNDSCLGTAWAVPFRLACRAALRPGTNRLRIDVTNLPANRIAALDRAGIEWRRFKDINIVDVNYKPSRYDDWEVMPSGLNSSVRLVRTGTIASPDSLNTWERGYTRPIGAVIRDVERQFGVSIKMEVDTTALLPYADSRVRAYSIEETLDNLLKPLDYRWEPKGRGKYVVRPFDYPRRQFDEGRKMLEYLSGLYNDRAQWEARRDSLVPDARSRLGIDEMLAARVADARPEYSKTRKHDGYTTRNFRIETLPGVHVCGTVYAPDARPGRRPADCGGKAPLIICPNGHFAGGRYNEAQQQRLGTLARMGAVCVSYDLVGWGESARELGEESHRTAMANTLQILNGMTILDHMLERGDIDTARVACNGGSGGGTQVITLALVDPRYTAACAVVSLAAHFDGGCPCESGRRITLAAGGSCHPEIAACFAPRPLGLVSDGGDWTVRVPDVELPYLRRVYGFYGAEDKVTDVHLPAERHDFGPNKRQAVYDFFCREFGLDSSRADESRVTIESEQTLMFGD